MALLLGRNRTGRVMLIADLPVDDDSTNFYVYDQAVEINLPWSPDAGQVDAIVKDMWRRLEKLSQIGMSAIYDTERDVMLDLATDFDAVLKRYIENIRDEEEEGEPQHTLAPVAPARSAGAPRAADAFTGNAGASKPWWKIW